MSKQQTYLSVVLDKNGKEIDFERWSYKRVQTVINSLKKLYFQDDALTAVAYKNIRRNGATVVIYSTATAPSEGIKIMGISLDELRK